MLELDIYNMEGQDNLGGTTTTWKDRTIWVELQQHGRTGQFGWNYNNMEGQDNLGGTTTTWKDRSNRTIWVELLQHGRIEVTGQFGWEPPLSLEKF